MDLDTEDQEVASSGSQLASAKQMFRLGSASHVPPVEAKHDCKERTNSINRAVSVGTKRGALQPEHPESASPPAAL